MGSSPLTRGKLPLDPPPVRMGGLIPAHAGKTGVRADDVHIPGAHPRSRGENAAASAVSLTMRGSSPLTRGKRGHVRVGHFAVRLIPAHAGKT